MSGKQKAFDDKEETTAQGAAGTSETESKEGAFNPNTETGIILQAEDPAWVSEILAAHQAVIESNKVTQQSNQSVIDALNELKDRASRTVGNYRSQIENQIVAEFDPEADYEVAEGKEFRAPNDFTTIHKEGDNVNHLGAEKLKSLLAQGLVTEVEPED